ILVTRPTNVIFIPLAIAITATSWAEVSARIGKLLHMRFAAPFLIGAFLMCLPQMAYCQYACGPPIKWSYSGEGFTNYLSRRLIPVWFAPANGMFPYSPLALVVLFACLAQRKAMHVM